MTPDTPRALEAAFERLAHLRPERHAPLAPLTTFRIGGPADLLVRPRTGEELVEAMGVARELGIPAFVLGRGANVLVGDRGFRGLVVRCEVGGVEIDPGEGRVRAGAGVQVFPDLIEATVAAGLGGLHHFVGIPSTVGGALWQNLHFLSPDRRRTVFVEEVLDSAEILFPDGRVEEVGVEHFRFGYDYSILHDRDEVVLSATFRLEPCPEEELRRVMRENLAWRAERHPDLRTHPSAGSVFRKVEGVGAGRLIEECGLKGRTVGGAQVSPKHANIIVNLGGATADDVRRLMDLVWETVLREKGVELVPEISLVGEF